MSRIVSRNAAKSVSYEDAPPLPLMMEDNSEILEAISQMSATLAEVRESVVAITDRPVLEAIKKLAAGQDTILALLRAIAMNSVKQPPKRQWRFTVNKDGYGDLVSVDAKEQ